MREGARKLVIRLVTLAVILAAWQVYGETVNPLLFSTPVKTVGGFLGLVSSGELAGNLGLTFRTFALGFIWAAAMGIPLGLALGAFRVVNIALEPYVNMLYSIPYITYIALVIIWFGVGEYSRMFIVFLASIFPIIINSMYGTKYVDYNLMETGRAFGANARQLLLKVQLPASVPFVMAGLRLGLGRALVGVLVAEMFLQIIGTGGLFVRYGDLLRADYVLALILVIGGIGITLAEVAKLAERRMARWKGATI